MNKSLTLPTVLFVVAGALCFCAQPAGAIISFKKEFESKYVKADSEEPNDVALREAVAAAKCYVCHVKGEKKSVRNAYGAALDTLLDKKEDKSNVEKIQQALDQVAAQKSDPDAADSPTFGELIASGKLPSGGEGE